MLIHESGVILESENFRRGIRTLAGVNRVQCPVIRPRGELEWLPWGYDAQTQIYTVPGGLNYGKELSLEAAKGRLYREFSTFPLTDDRSFSVHVAAMCALYIRHLPGGSGLRPGILYYANKVGAGKSVLAKACLYPVLGRAAAAKLKKNEELDKELEAFSRARVPYIFLDNIYGGINSAAIDQFLTSEESTGRAMGGHGVFTGQNSALMLATGNQIEVNDDASRRFMLVDLFEKGTPDERVVDVPLDDARMKTPEWREAMLECMAALVRHWHEAGMPPGSISLPSFEAYAALLGGIVEAAGYLPPFTKAVLPDAKTSPRSEFVDFVAAVMQEVPEDGERLFTLPEMAAIARAGGFFTEIVGTVADGVRLAMKIDGIPAKDRASVVDRGEMDKTQDGAFGKFLKKEVGTEFLVGTRKVEFGARKHARKRVYLLRWL